MARIARQNKAKKPSRTPTPELGPESESDIEGGGRTIPSPPPPILRGSQQMKTEPSVKDDDTIMEDTVGRTRVREPVVPVRSKSDPVLTARTKQEATQEEITEGIKQELESMEKEGGGMLGSVELGNDQNAEMKPSPSDFSLRTSPSMPPTSSISTSTTNSPFDPQTPSTPLTDTPQPNDSTNRPSKAKKPKRSEPQLIGHLPVARDAALACFTEIPDNNYQYNTLGRSREALEGLTCDCVYEHGVDDFSTACGHGSDCINRLTQVECLPDDCRCGRHCQNQRFQRKDYAPIEIVQTEKKGFGLRAESNISKDDFIYEYVGDVVNSPSFKKRMRDYASEGIKHFYFMMLQKDEFIDATKRGGIGRFANHSCSPNCYVAKWTVGSHVRMGIFAHRDIKQYEELTFNYNVDRYGHEAQPCYCGEPNCIGYLGGKTQTDIATMDDLYLDALGITDEADLMELKGTRKKKGKKIDDPDFMPVLHSLVVKDVPKVMQAMRQTQSRKVLLKLLTRIQMTEDLHPLRQIMRLRGFTVMKNILDDYSKDTEIIVQSLQCMATWPLLGQNKVRDSRVLDHVKTLVESGEEQVKKLAEKLVENWEALPIAYRIPKRAREDGDDEPAAVVSLAADEVFIKKLIYPNEIDFKSLLRPTVRPVMPEPEPEPAAPLPPKPVKRNVFSESDIRSVIEAASREREEAERLAALKIQQAKEEAEAKAQAKAKELERRERKKAKTTKKHHTPEEKEALKEKRLTKLVGAIVVKCMSKHSKSMDHDTFKKHAKELTQVIVEKEKKSSSYKEGRLDSLSDEKVTKIKKFSKEFIAKILRKQEKSRQGHRKPHSSSVPTASSSATKLDTPEPVDEGTPVDFNVDDVMDLGPDSPSEDEGEDEPMDGLEDESPTQKALATVEQDGMMDVEMVRRQPDEKNQMSMDPRRRPPSSKADHLPSQSSGASMSWN